MRETDWAYLAGILDGEGYVSIFVSPSQLKATVVVVNCNMAIIDRCKEILRAAGVPHSVGRYPDERHRRKPTYRLTVNGGAAGVAEMLRRCRPYLAGKVRQADVLIAFCERLVAHDYIHRPQRTRRGETRYGPEDIAAVNEIRRLNWRGPLEDDTPMPELLSVKPAVWRGNGMLAGNYWAARKSFEVADGAAEGPVERLAHEGEAAASEDTVAGADG